MTKIQVEQNEPLDEENLEEWARVTDEEHLFGVCVTRSSSTEWPWHVSIYVAEYIRSEPLQTELWTGITEALRGLPGVRRVAHEDREVWIVQGDVGGEDLVRTCAEVVDRLGEATREVVEAP